MPKIKLLYVNLALAALTLFLALVNLLVYVNPEKRNPVILDGMQTSEAVYTQESGRRSRMVIEGTVPHGTMPNHFGSGPVEADKAAAVFFNPYKAGDAAVLERGKLVYDRFCMACHVEKAGDEPREVVKRGVPAPPPLITKRVAGFKDGYIYNYVSKGGALMPAHGPQIPEDDRWKLITYLRHRLDEEKGNLR